DRDQSGIQTSARDSDVDASAAASVPSPAAVVVTQNGKAARALPALNRRTAAPANSSAPSKVRTMSQGFTRDLPQKPGPEFGPPVAPGSNCPAVPLSSPTGSSANSDHRRSPAAPSGTGSPSSMATTRRRLLSAVIE